ncbi:MAG: hypothetical protein ACJA1R_002390 [Flavobacteriales bacterium]|jgi:hypothetical protein
MTPAPAVLRDPFWEREVMKRLTLWKLAMLFGAVTMFGCPSSDDAAETPEAAEGSGTEEGSGAAEGEAAEGSGAAEGEAAPADEAAGSPPAAEAAAAPTSDFAATAEHLHATWNLDLQASMAEMPEEQRQMMAMVMASMSINIVFAAEGNMTMTIAGMPGAAEPQVQSGTYSVSGVEGATVSFSASMAAEGAPPETQGMTAMFMDANTLRLASDDGEDAMTFTRAM